MRQKLALFEKFNYICRTNKKLGVMKKHVLILLAIVGIIYACMAFSNDDNAPSSLDGTAWASPQKSYGVKILTFREKDFSCTMFNNNKSGVEHGAYKYNAPKVTLTYKMRGTDKQKVVEGYIKDNKLTFDNFVYTRQ